MEAEKTGRRGTRIYTLTFNPAVDYTVWLDRLELGGVNRAQREELRIGGKGVNVSLMLRRLGVESVALGFLAGFTGQAVERELRAQGVGTDFIHLDEGFTRINVKIQGGGETALNGRGPRVGEGELERLLARLETLGAGDILVLAGAVPAGLPGGVYQRILEGLAGRGVEAVVDAEGELLRRTLGCRPFLIKPNSQELGQLFGRPMRTEGEIRAGAAALQRSGARNVLVSLGGEGALLLDEGGGFHRMAAPRGRVGSSVGAGDAMVAGFLAGWLAGGGCEGALRLGVAAGSATAFSRGLATREAVEALWREL